MGNVISMKDWKHRKLQEEIDKNVMTMVQVLMFKADQLRQNLQFAKTMEEAKEMLEERWKLINNALQQAVGNNIDVRMDVSGRYSIKRRTN